MEHPIWCDRTQCTAADGPRRGRHWSRRAVLDPDPRTGIAATVRIGRGAGPTLVDLTVHMPAAEATDDTEYLLIMEAEPGRRPLTVNRWPAAVP